uniref:AAA family ATPase n=1 Tax=Dyella sp. ASV21 TaxID=2795114 RepID=UPI0018EB198E
GRAVDDRRIGELQTLQLAIGEKITQLQHDWERQKQLVDTILTLRGQQEEGADSDTLGDTSAAQPELIEAVSALAELQRQGALLHADVGAEQIAQVIADWTGIPANAMTADRMDRLSTLPSLLGERIKGQGVAIERVHKHLLTAMADLRRPGTPLGAFLLVGPSGVGKTETALALADALFGGKQFLTTINMSEYQEKHTVSRLLGAPPGYVGYGEGGILTEAIRQRPYSVVLLDEVEKAHPEVLNIFYQAFDKGELADGEGRLIDCKNVLFFLTSNLGFDQQDGSLCDLDEATLRGRIMQFFKPALLARMQVVPYQYLDESVLGEIVQARLQRLGRQFTARYDATLVLDESATAELRTRCTRHENGARILDASLDGDLLPPLSLAVLQRIAAGTPFTRAQLGWDGGVFTATLD